MQPDDRPPKKKITLSGLRNAFKLYSYIKPYRVIYILGLFFLFGSSLANLAFPKLLGDLVNSGNEGNLGEDLNRIALLLGGILLIQAVFSYFRTILFVKVTERSLADLRQDTYNHLIRLPVKFFDKRRVGELNSRISSDISLLQQTMNSNLAEFARQVIIIVGGVALLTLTSSRMRRLSSVSWPSFREWYWLPSFSAALSEGTPERRSGQWPTQIPSWKRPFRAYRV